MNIRIGSRKSALALKQTELVIEELKRSFPGDTFEIVTMSTRGDREQNRSLQSFGGKGVFIEEIENALRGGAIDMAVHSAKDMPTDITDGLVISAALLRADRRDVLVHYGDTISNEAIIGTSSLRREIQAKKLFPDAKFKPIRGNIRTRLDKVKRGEFDACIMAKAAIDRLGITDIRITELGGSFICAAGQGILAVETAKGRMERYAAAINDTAVMAELTAERAFLANVGGGCHAPCGASAVYEGGHITLDAFCVDKGHEARLTRKGNDAEELGKAAAEEIKKWFI